MLDLSSDTEGPAEPSGSYQGLAAVEAERLLEQLVSLEADVVAGGAAVRPRLGALHPRHRRSAVNLAQYLAVRSRDIRSLQADLARFGLSSLGRSESHTLATVDQVRRLLSLVAGHDPGPPGDAWLSFDESLALLTANTDALFGPAPGGRTARIMVTMPSEAAGDYAWVEDLVRRGMDCARINAAHDSPAGWAAIADNVRKAGESVGRPCAVQVDLAGPKLRTGPLPHRPGSLKLRPGRDAVGRVTPARAWLTAEEQPLPAPEPAPTLPVPEAWLDALHPGSWVDFLSGDGQRRAIRIVECSSEGAWAETLESARLLSGTLLEAPHGSARLGTLPGRERALLLRPGDPLVLTRTLVPEPSDGSARIGCTLPAVFDHLRAGHRIWFDDGRIGGIVTSVGPEEAVIEIDRAPRDGAKLRSEKGINLPDTDLHLPAVGPDDQAALEFAANHADLIGVSFVQRASDVDALRRRLTALGGEHLGLVLKVETKKAFLRLPELILAAMASARVGVMIARGDLAVECGFERLAELQEEILWICEAAHLPVIWATEVLDRLAKTGQPSRAEITDAAMAQRAECVMLNKGRHVEEAVATLDDILRRMTGHQRKKNPLLRRLQAWPPGPA